MRPSLRVLAFSLIYFLLGAGRLGYAERPFAISAPELAEFAAAAAEKVPEIRAARRLANARNVRLALTGAASRDLLFWTQAKAEALGSRDGFRLWLQDQTSLPLFTFLGLGTTLDFVAIDGAAQSSSTRQASLRDLKTELAKELPGTIFYGRPRLHPREELVGATRTHYEAWEQMAIDERGAAALPALGTRVNGETINLSDWGLRQIASDSLVFQMYAGPGLPPKPQAENDLAQALRWIGAQSAYPNLRVSDASKAQLRELLQRLKLLPGLNKLWQRPGPVLDALAELKGRSPDPLRTRALLDEYGISGLARAAGAADKIPVPLPAAADPDGVAGEALGEEMTFHRRVPYREAQAFAAGALWRESMNGGPAGLYLSANADALSKDDIYLDVSVPATAREGVDFLRFEDYFVILHRAAITRADGTLRISPVDAGFLARQQTERLRQLNHTSAPNDEKDAVLAALGSLIDPLTRSADAKAFREIWQAGGGDRRTNGALLDTLLARPEILRQAFATGDPFWRALLSYLRMEKGDETSAVAAVKAYSVKERPAVMKALPLGARTRSRLAEYPAALAAVRGSDVKFWERFLDALVADHAFRADHLSPDLSHPAELAFLRRLAAQPDKIAGLRAPILTPPQAEALERAGGHTLALLIDASLRAEVPLPRPLHPDRPADLALLRKYAGNAADRWSRVDWLGRHLLSDAAVAALKKREAGLWAKVLGDSLLRGYPAPGEASAYQFDASNADHEAVRDFLATAAHEFGTEPALDMAFTNPLLIRQAEFRSEVLAELPALAQNVPVHRMKVYAERLLGDEDALDRIFALMREKAKNSADLVAIVDPELKDVSFPSEQAKEAYLNRLAKIASEETKRYDSLAKSPFQRDTWRDLQREIRGGPPAPSRMPASVDPR